MSIVIFDTETTSLNKPFCYNIGYVILDTENNTILCKRDFVIEQIWHNLPLFNTAYYADKRPIYVNRMKSRTTTMKKFGHITQTMLHDFKLYDVSSAYAYNSDFDERVFNFNCDWFKCINPFDTVPIFDIRKYFLNIIFRSRFIEEDFLHWCDKYEKYTDTGNYSTTAETVYQYLTDNLDFVEEHTALKDSEIETEILQFCLNNGCVLEKDYKVPSKLERKILKTFTVKKGKEILFETDCYKITYYKSKNTISLK